VTQLRRETTELLQDTLGQQRLQELRAQGQAMSTDDAVAYLLDHRDHHLRVHTDN
jgi:hypothetical protein